MTTRTQRSLIQAITSTHIWKNICRIEIFKFNFKPTPFKEVTRGNKWPTPKAEKYIRQLDFIQNYVNYNVYPPGCTDSNVTIIYHVKRFFQKVNLFKCYFSGSVNLEKKSWPVWKSQPPAWVLLGKPTLISIKNLAKSLQSETESWLALARRETWLALAGNNHCLLISYVSLMLSDNIITLIRGNTK